MVLALVLGMAGSALPARVQAASIPGPHASRIHIESFDPHVLRIWVARDATAKREPSLATDAAPRQRVPLHAVTEGSHRTVSTGELAVRMPERTLDFEVRLPRTDKLLLPAFSLTYEPGSAGWALTRPVVEGEQLMGLGQDNRNNGRLDRRGTVRELWAGQQINSGNVTAEYPVPLLMGLLPDGSAYGMFFDNAHRLRFDLGKSKPGEMRLDAEGGELDIYVIAGPKLTDVIERYTRLTGRPSLPPLWALGFWQSKCTYYDWAALDEAYQELHKRGYPVDVMVLDYDWPEFFNNFVWAKRWHVGGKTPADRVREYAAKGVKIVMSQTGPMVKQDSPTYATGLAAGIFATDAAGDTLEAGHYGGRLLDFTHPRINEWLWPQVTARIGDGVAGWWLDLTEPEGEPPQTRYFGGTPANVHNEYSQRVTRSFEGVQLAAHPDRRPFILTRTGSAGTQAHHAAVWTGDVYSDYATLRAHAPEMLNSGLSGLVWWTSDSGGFMEGYYKNDQFGAHGRLYERWMQLSVFSPITRAHKAGGAPEPYRFGAAVEQGTLHYLKLRYRLLPYIYTQAWQASRTGVPITRPLALAFQDDPGSRGASGDQYMFGGDLLVAPVLFEGQTKRSVYFPPGRWFDWDTGLEYTGGRTWVVAAPQNRIPVGVRAGAIIPLAPEMLNTAEKPWDPLTLEIYPQGKSSFTLYRDDGQSFGYRRGEHTLTRFTSDATKTDEMVFGIEESNKKFVSKQYIARFHLDAEPRRVVAGGHELKFEWSADTRVLTVPLSLGAARRLAVRVELGAKLPARLAPELTAEPVDATSEASGAGGKPVPHFFPPTQLPNRIRAVNYDKGGEGTAFHTTRQLPVQTHYRPDDFSIARLGGGSGDFVLSGLRKGEWMRYTVNAGGGGYFDLSARVASAAGGARLKLLAADQLAADIRVPETGDAGRFVDVAVPNVYLNPGEVTLMVFAETDGVALDGFEFKAAASPPATYAAALGKLQGTAEVRFAGEGSDGRGLLDRLGRIGSTATYGIGAKTSGPATLRIRYRNTSGQPVRIAVRVGAGPVQQVSFPPVADDGWQTLDVVAHFEPGPNTVSFSGIEETWNSISLDRISIVPRAP
jgi:alpha-glucosidase